MIEKLISTAAILEQMPGINKCRRKFMSHIFGLFLAIPQRINFSRMCRYGQYTERMYHYHFAQAFDFQLFNSKLIHSTCSGYYVLGFDPSYIPKSGKHTYGKGKYWSGCAQSAKHGLEIGNFSVVDVTYQTAFHLKSVQTPSLSERKANDEDSLVVHYANTVISQKVILVQFSNYLAVDSYFVKEKFINPILEQTDLHIISRLRSDANLKYLFYGTQSEGRGAPRKYTTKIDLKNVDFEYFKLAYEDENIKIYDAVVFCVFLKRNIRVAYTQFMKDGKVSSIKLYFSTDLALPAIFIAKYYIARFHQEFTFRDAKQFTGLTHAQTKSKQKLDMHFNISLTSVNIAKAEALNKYKQGDKLVPFSFSMADAKRLAYNELYTNAFISIFQIDPKLNNNKTKIAQLLQFGTDFKAAP
jgi:hypothetical protein